MSYGYRQAVPFTATCPICHWKFESTESQTAANAKAARCGARPAATFKYEEGLEIKVPKSKGSKTFKTYKIVRRYTSISFCSLNIDRRQKIGIFMRIDEAIKLIIRYWILRQAFFEKIHPIFVIVYSQMITSLFFLHVFLICFE